MCSAILSLEESVLRQKDYKHIIWDWNGTLFDDVDIAIDAMNNLLKRRKLPLLNRDTYKQIFTFPVRDYYAQLGFDFEAEPFEVLAAEYIAEFHANDSMYKLFPDAHEVLLLLKSMGKTQSILSATEQSRLNEMVDSLGVTKYFSTIAGISDYYAHSKVEAGRMCIDNLALIPDEVVLIGDTVHDFEVASALGCDCMLVASGHQSYERLSPLKARIVYSLTEAGNYLG